MLPVRCQRSYGPFCSLSNSSRSYFSHPPLPPTSSLPGRTGNPCFRTYAPGAAVTLQLPLERLGCSIFQTQRDLIPAGHERASLQSLVSAAKLLSVQSFRSFLFDSYGTVHTPFSRIAFPVCIVLGIACLLSLRATPEGRWLRIYGASCLICSALLLLVRWYEFSPRLVAYGLVALIAGFRPVKHADWLWMLFGLASLANGVVNGLTVNSLGALDPRYTKLVEQFEAWSPATAKVATNASSLLFLRRDLVSIGTADDALPAGCDKILWITLPPQFDAIIDLVIPVPRPGAGWCEEKQFPGAVLFSRCVKAP